MSGKMIVTLTGGIKLLLKFCNQLLGALLVFTGAWVMFVFYVPHKITVNYNPVYASRYEHLSGAIFFFSLLFALVIFAINCYRFYKAMPDTIFTRFIKSLFKQNYNPEREGNNIPDFMKNEEKKNTGFFFGEKTQGWWNPKSFYVGKPTDKDGHILVVGGAGSGKSACIAKNVLEAWNAPIIAIDIKGELSAHYKQLKEAGKVSRHAIIFDPTDENSFGYDPYFSLRTGGKTHLVQNAREIALSIIPLPTDMREPFWVQGAQNLLTASILYYYGIGATFSETMTGIQTTAIDKLIEEITDSDNLPAKMFINQIRDLELKTLAGIATEMANKIMVFASDPLINGALRDSKTDTKYFNWNSLDVANIFLRLPEDKLDQWSADILLKINQLIRSLERRADFYSEQGKALPPILILLDEFPRLGKIEAIKGALATLRSKNVTICLMVQSLAQLDEIYGEKARRTIVDNCPYKAILGVTDADSQKYFSNLIGTCEVEKESHGVHYDADDGIATAKGSHWSKQREPIIFPHDLAKLKDIVLMTPDGFCRVNKSFATGKEAKNQKDT
ncbi:MAG: type IV secretory system conjugative DNA transfer family protein [Oscillospiraceae bacterium]|nr:type IV secretory system conjugative DNA transfer family protein [Oscillospiraceae bacterium]